MSRVEDIACIEWRGLTLPREVNLEERRRERYALFEYEPALGACWWTAVGVDVGVTYEADAWSAHWGKCSSGPRSTLKWALDLCDAECRRKAKKHLKAAEFLLRGLETKGEDTVAKEQTGDLSTHLYNFAGAAAFAEVLRASSDVRLGARKCLELAKECVAWNEAQRFPDSVSRYGLRTHQGDVPVALMALDNFLEHRFALVANEWVLAPLSECRVGDVVYHLGWSYVVEEDGDGRRQLRGDGLRMAFVTNETVVARRKTPAEILAARPEQRDQLEREMVQGIHGVAPVKP